MPHAIRVHEPGGPETLRWEAVEVPAPGPGEVRVRHAAIGVNFIDVYHRTGLYPQPLPFTPGLEAAGRITEVGSDVTGLQVGDRVAYGTGPAGAYAEERVIPAAHLLRLPDAIGDEQAAAAMLKGMTAEYLLRRTHRVQQGETVLIHAAAGGVGLILSQWARALGATVIGTAGSRTKAELAAAHGCHHVLALSEGDFVGEVRRLTGGRGVDVVYDSVGKDTFLGSLDCLRPRGLLVSFGQSSGKAPSLDPLLLSAKGSLFLTRPSLMAYTANRTELEQSAAALFDVLSRGVVKIEVNQRRRLVDAAEAHAELEARRTTGSTILLP